LPGERVADPDLTPRELRLWTAVFLRRHRELPVELLLRRTEARDLVAIACPVPRELDGEVGALEHPGTAGQFPALVGQLACVEPSVRVAGRRREVDAEHHVLGPR